MMWLTLSCTVQPGQPVGVFHSSSVSELHSSTSELHVSSRCRIDGVTGSVGETMPVVYPRTPAAAPASAPRRDAPAAGQDGEAMAPSPARLTVATWNVNGLRARARRIEGWLARNRVDVLLVSETRADPGDPAEAALLYDGRHLHHHSRPGGRNGVAISATRPLKDPLDGFDAPIAAELRHRAEDEGWDATWCDDARLTSAVVDGVRVASVYVPNGRTPDHPH